jgi:putative ABC transport system ATP-binding protein
MSEMVRLKDICKSYYLGKQELPILKNINLTIKKKEYMAIMGPSGSGKSTLMNILGCLDVPSSGSYHLGNEDVSCMNDNQLAQARNQYIGFVFQTFNLLPKLSALKNVEVPLLYCHRKYAPEEMERVLIRVGLKDRMHHRPSELSGGQRQRIAIARALINNPLIILADEPTGNLDTKTSEEIMDLFAELNSQGKTIILVSHSPHISKYARRTVYIVDGVLQKRLKAGVL